MSIDVEDWFHVENLRRVVARDTWHVRQLRVEKTMERKTGTVPTTCGNRFQVIMERTATLMRARNPGVRNGGRASAAE